MTNKDLSKLVNQTIKDNGINKTFISDKLGVTRQQIDNLLNKKQFSIDDANKILNIIGYEIDNISIKKLK
jgi:predicted XRE-type DNA-binding protein